MQNQITINQLLHWIRKTTPANAKVLIPISGGSDSALCFWLYAQAMRGCVKGVYVGTGLRAKAWFEAQGEVYYSDLDISTLHASPEIARWAHFLALSIQENRILVGSRNRTEDTLGTFSHASKVCSLLPLAGMWKSEVMALCEQIGMPLEIIASSKRADPACGRPQRMADIPFEVVDAFLQAKTGEIQVAVTCTPDQQAYVEKIYAANSYKQNLPLKGPQPV